MAWSTFIPDLATLESAGDKLLVDDAYVAIADHSSGFTVGGLDDGLALVLHGDPDPERPVEYVAVVRAVCASGHAVSGIAVGIELAEKATEITGTPAMFVADSTGSYGGVAWLTAYENVRQLEAGQTALAADPSFAALVDEKASGCYVEDANLTTQFIYRRII